MNILVDDVTNQRLTGQTEKPLYLIRNHPGMNIYSVVRVADVKDISIDLYYWGSRKGVGVHEIANFIVEVIDSNQPSLTPGEWNAFENNVEIPFDEHEPFLVLLPGNDAAKFLIVQVSFFEGRMYPDAKDCIIDHSDEITNATHWKPCGDVPNV